MHLIGWNICVWDTQNQNRGTVFLMKASSLTDARFPAPCTGMWGSKHVKYFLKYTWGSESRQNSIFRLQAVSRKHFINTSWNISGQWITTELYIRLQAVSREGADSREGKIFASYDISHTLGNGFDSQFNHHREVLIRILVSTSTENLLRCFLWNLFQLLASWGERRNAKRRVDRRRELPVTVIWENRTTS